MFEIRLSSHHRVSNGSEVRRIVEYNSTTIKLKAVTVIIKKILKVLIINIASYSDFFINIVSFFVFQLKE